MKEHQQTLIKQFLAICNSLMYPYVMVNHKIFASKCQNKISQFSHVSFASPLNNNYYYF